MAERCLAPGCRSLGNLTDLNHLGQIMAIHPSLSEYKEVPLCDGCGNEAQEYGIQVVSLIEARYIIRENEIAIQRQAFFRSFVPVEEEERTMVAS